MSLIKIIEKQEPTRVVKVEIAILRIRFRVVIFEKKTCKYMYKFRQGLLYRWTEHSADYFFQNFHWGREMGPPNYTLGLDFLDHDLLQS